MVVLQHIPEVPETHLENKVAARNAVKAAIKRGDIKPLVKCALCGGEAHSYHHHSYSPVDWLDVTPVCMSCHKTLHAVGRESFLNVRIASLNKQLDRSFKQLRTTVQENRRIGLYQYISTIEAQMRWLVTSQSEVLE
jgi:hypothetical protein